jgi:hypothetical protein
MDMAQIHIAIDYLVDLAQTLEPKKAPMKIYKRMKLHF